MNSLLPSQSLSCSSTTGLRDLCWIHCLFSFISYFFTAKITHIILSSSHSWNPQPKNYLFYLGIDKRQSFGLFLLPSRKYAAPMTCKPSTFPTWVGDVVTNHRSPYKISTETDYGEPMLPLKSKAITYKSRAGLGIFHSAAGALMLVQELLCNEKYPPPKQKMNK